MENTGRLFSQVAAEAGITPNKAKVAVYLFGLSQSGCSLSYAAGMLRRKPDYVKRYSREFLIDFSDYRPFSRLELKGKPRPEPKYLLAVAGQ